MNEINFLPHDFVQQEGRRRGAGRQYALLGLLGLFILIWYFTARADLPALEAAVQAIEVEKANFNVQKMQCVKLQTRLGALQERLRIQSELSQPLAYSAILATISELMPDSIALTHIAMPSLCPPIRMPGDDKAKKNDAKGSEEDSYKPWEHLKVAIDGVAPSELDIANFIGAIEAHPLFEEIKIQDDRSTRIDSYKARVFRIGLRIRLDRDYRYAGQSARFGGATTRVGEVPHKG